MKKPTMSERLLERTKGAAERASQNISPLDSIAAKPPVTMPGQLGAFRLEAQRYKDQIEELQAKLREAEMNATSQDIPLDQLHEVLGRKRKLTKVQYEELRENLRHNELITPIVVRRREEGGYEIVSGHNRVDVYRELGRTSIAAVVRDTEAVQADIHAFYANLLQPSLPDYEKYLGFCMIKQYQPDISHEAIADMAGLSRSQVTKLMAFAALPPEAHEILREHVDAVGAGAAQDLANLAKAGREKQVVAAIQKMADGTLDQGQAVKFAAAESQTKPVANKIEPIKIKAGRSTYCEYRRADKVIRLAFKTAEDAEAVEDAIREVLEARASKQKI